MGLFLRIDGVDVKAGLLKRCDPISEHKDASDKQQE